ncbi:RNA polymerase sigma factor [Dictyobacter kobayashii]|uniref:RNA polymerase sigma factor n=1 Tax=Dictyobacter kobayashii TaxID=2014872 RepID=A0A402AHR1_9CHLR|nr:RNA polymerase sigma factor [Dictyobacter kobayashii]GCE18658.1 hypothetical protein KDK_24580 [Dictyobacter kobayashii]
MAPSDLDLLERVCARDTAAFEMLSSRYRTLVYWHVFSCVHDADAAEDVVQEVFLLLWLRAEQWQGHGTLQGWLLRIAHNQALNYLRSVSRRRQQPLEVPVEFTEDGDEKESIPDWMVDQQTLEPGLLLVEREHQQLLQELIEGLPVEKREVFRLVHDGDLGVQEVADMLSIPTGTVKSRLHYATKRLARQWFDLNKDEEDL